MLNRIIYSLGIRMVMALLFLGAAGVASLASHTSSKPAGSSNPWSKNHDAVASSGHDRTRKWHSSSSRPKYETVYVDKDGVAHGKEDLKAYDPNEIEIHDSSGRVVSQ